MGHHHHHHPPQSSGPGQGPYFGRGAGIATGWPLAIGVAAVLFAYGAFDGFATYRVYAHGQRGMGVVARVHDGTTILEVEGHVCAITGEVGRAGGMIPVAFPPGRPGACVVRQLGSFRWPIGAMVTGGAILAGIWFVRRSTVRA